MVQPRKLAVWFPPQSVHLMRKLCVNNLERRNRLVFFITFEQTISPFIDDSKREIVNVAKIK